MKLFLAAEAKHPESLEKLKSFVGKDFKDITISYIPTASNGEFYGCWKGGDSIKVAKALGAKLKIVELEDKSYKDVVSEIRGADIIWIAGGMAGYLMYWIRRVELDKVLPDLLEKGAIYVGSSAGSMVCAKTIKVADWFIGETEPGASLLPGLGFIDFEIYPHFEDDLLSEIKSKKSEGVLHLLRNGDVITLIDDKVETLGEEIILK
jgi:peptidase E